MVALGLNHEDSGFLVSAAILTLLQDAARIVAAYGAVIHHDRSS